MSSKRIRVFLGGYINQTNAQNLNCFELAKHLDKNRFEVFTLSIAHGNLGKNYSEGYHVFNCRFPVKLTSYLGFLWGIYKSDIAYLPRANNYKYCRLLLKIFKRKSFKQIERVIDKESPERFSPLLKDLKQIRSNYFYTTRTYAISKHIRDYCVQHFSFPMQPEVLHVPVNVEEFEVIRTLKCDLRNLVLIGNDLVRKGVFDLLKLAEKFPSLTFHIIGRDDQGIVKQTVSDRNLRNVRCYGQLRFSEITRVLRDADLHLLLSKSEGFGKVTIECAAAGIPSIVYNTYGAEEWIENEKNGLILSSLNEVENEIQRLIQEPGRLESLSSATHTIPLDYLPKTIVKKYEGVIEEILNPDR